MTEDFKSKIIEYYTFLDNNEKEKSLALFSSDAVYKRCEDIYLGKPDIVEFFTKKYKLKGKHEILKMNQDKETIIVRGIFDGINGRDEQVRDFFCDIFTFNEDGLVFTRETYLARGAKDIN